jgi:uncharacterized membrane protein YhhN
MDGRDNAPRSSGGQAWAQLLIVAWLAVIGLAATFLLASKGQIVMAVPVALFSLFLAVMVSRLWDSARSTAPRNEDGP